MTKQTFSLDLTLTKHLVPITYGKYHHNFKWVVSGCETIMKLVRYYCSISLYNHGGSLSPTEKRVNPQLKSIYIVVSTCCHQICLIYCVFMLLPGFSCSEVEILLLNKSLTVVKSVSRSILQMFKVRSFSSLVLILRCRST